MPLKSTLKSIFKMISNHGYALLYYHNPILPKKKVAAKILEKRPLQTGTKGWDTIFLFPLLSMIISSMYGIFFMVYSEADQFSWATLKTFPRMMYHQVVPQIIWPQCDVAWTILALQSTALYAIALRNPCTLDCYQAVQNCDLQNCSVRLSIHGKS